MRKYKLNAKTDQPRLCSLYFLTLSIPTPQLCQLPVYCISLVGTPVNVKISIYYRDLYLIVSFIILSTLSLTIFTNKFLNYILTITKRKLFGTITLHSTFQMKISRLCAKIIRQNRWAVSL